MRKGLVVLLVAVVVAMFAVPAMAGLDVSGFYRAKAYMSNFKNASTTPMLGKDGPTASYVEQRIRIKWSFGEENVKAVFFTENDISAWGDQAGSTNVTGASPGGAMRNTGGALGADRINTEIKNTYVWFKLPDTTLDFTVGLQNQSDAYAGLLFGAADMAGVFANGKFDPVALSLGWAKLYENNFAKADDLTLYVASAKIAPTKELSVGINFYFLQDDTQKTPNATALPFAAVAGAENKKRIYVPGVNAAFNAGPATISGFFLYETGKIDFISPSVVQDIDISGFAGDLRGDVNLGPGKGFIEGLYISGGDGSDATKFKSIFTLSDVNASPGGNSFFARTDMSILLSNADDINTNQALIGAASAVSGQSPNNGGRGIWHVAAGYTQKLTEKLTGKVGVGYMASNKLTAADKLANKKKPMGTEINANVNYNILKGLDFGLYGAYAFLGDFYKGVSSGGATTPANEKPDNAYDAHMRLNYAF